jgi:hypothetical protein
MYSDMRKGNGNCRIVKENLEVILQKMKYIGKVRSEKRGRKGKGYVLVNKRMRRQMK